MPSNKKKKGKARRKKTNSAATSNDDNTLSVAAPITERPAQTQTAHQVLVYLGRALMSGARDQENHRCLHGLPSLELSDQPECLTFLTTFFDEIEKHDNGGHVVNAAALAMQETLPNTPVASLTESTQKLINAWFVCIGVKCLLEVTTMDNGHDNDPAAAMALATLELEDFCSAFFSESRKRNDDSMTVLTDDGRGKVRDLLCGGERALTKFFRRRITCSCLDTKYMLVKPLPRTGSCSWCCTRKKLKELKICSGCNVCHYCSRVSSYLPGILAKATSTIPPNTN